MGTKADFYIGMGKKMAWLGSVGYDGYEHGISDKVKDSKTVSEYKNNLREWLETLSYSTLPKQGWPWPWLKSSEGTECVYTFYHGQLWTVYTSHSSDEVWIPLKSKLPKVTYPDMSKYPLRKR